MSIAMEIKQREHFYKSESRFIPADFSIYQNEGGIFWSTEGKSQVTEHIYLYKLLVF